MIVDVIISDLVPLRERGNYIAIVLTVYSIGTTLGPWAGGAIVETTSWRWVFYLNCMLTSHNISPIKPAGPTLMFR
jgi:MFS family permease